MKHIRKICSIVLCVVMALSCFGFAALAEEGGGDPTCEHVMSVTVVPPTCADQGYQLHVCTKCGYHYDDNYTDALGHSYGPFTETRAATCTEEGLMERVCSRCGGLDTKTLPVLPHVDEDEDGYCDVCHARVEVKKIFSPYEWLKSFIAFIRDLIQGIFA